MMSWNQRENSTAVLSSSSAPDLMYCGVVVQAGEWRTSSLQARLGQSGKAWSNMRGNINKNMQGKGTLPYTGSRR